MKELAATVNFHCIFSSPANAQLLSLTSSPQLNGPICPRTIEFTCVGTRVPIVLDWILNNTLHGRYTYKRDTRPVNITLNPPIPGVMAQVTSVSPYEDSVSMNITSTLSGGASALDGSSVQCTASTFTSEIYIVNVIGIINITYDLCMGVDRDIIGRSVSMLSPDKFFLLKEVSFVGLYYT